MTGLGGENGHLRAGHADRERAVSVLKAAFVQGRLAKDEFDLRVGQALASRTCADLGAVTADLPAGLVPAAPPAAPVKPAGDPANRTVAKVITCITAVWVSFWGVVAVVFPGELHSPGAYVFFALLMLTVLPGSPAALLMFHSWLEKRAIDPPPQPVPAA